MLVKSTATDVRTPVEVYDSDGLAVSGLTYLSAITFEYRTLEAGAWVPVTLIAGGTGHVDGGFRNQGDNVYDMCWPDAAVVTDESTLIRYTYDGVTKYDTIDAKLIVPSNNVELPALTTPTAATLYIYQGDDYVGADWQQQIDITTAMDLTGLNVLLLLRKGSGASVVDYAFRFPAEGTSPSHYINFDLTGAETDVLEAGTYDLLIRLEESTNDEHVLGSGTCVIYPWKTPATIVDKT